MSLDFTRMDLVKCICIIRPGLNAVSIAQLLNVKREDVDPYVSRLASSGLIAAISGSRYARRFKATGRLIDSFRVTNDMLEYLGLKDGGGGKKKKCENGIFGECKKSPHQQRMMWFYGRGEFPGFGQLS